METAEIEVFTSPTCPFCPGAKKAVEEVAKERNDVSYSELNVATPEGSIKAREFEVFSVPTIFVRGPAVNEIMALKGIPSKEKLNELIDIGVGLKKLPD